jgi:hypothetical protein
MRAVRNDFSSSGVAIVLLAVLGLGVPAGLASLDADAQDHGVLQRGHNDPCAQRPSERGAAIGHEQQCPPEGGSAGVARGDFNGDTVTDLAIGVPGEDRALTTFDGLSGGTTRDVPDAGAVHIIYGSASGLTSAENQLLDQGVGKEDNDRFGAALAAGDFNGDPYSDLAVGVPGERNSSGNVVGAVQIFYGTPEGLVRTGSQTFRASLFTIPVSGPDLSVLFQESMSLVWGDFDGNSVGDLAIEGAARSPSCDVGVVLLLGAVAQPLSTSRKQEVFLRGGCRPGTASGDAALAAGDFDSDGRDELVVGTPHALFFTIRSGRVTILTGDANGVVPEPAQEITEPSLAPGLDDADPESGDQFGAALAVGDFNGDGHKDLAVGTPGEDVGNSTLTIGINSAGAVSIFTGSASGSGVLSFAQKLTQDSPGIELAEANDVFGAALAANNFNGDAFTDLAIGAPGETLAGQAGAGAVSVIYGTEAGLSTAAGTGHPAHQFFHEDVSGFSSTTEVGDRFGTSLSAWNFGNGAQADLIIGVPFETVNVLVSPFVFRPIADAGAVHAVYGSSTGLSTTTVQFWNQNSSGILEEAELNDQFGLSVY